MSAQPAAGRAPEHEAGGGGAAPDAADAAPRAPLVDTADPLQPGPGRVKRAVRHNNELVLSVGGSGGGGGGGAGGGGGSGGSTGSGSPGPASARAASASASRPRGGGSGGGGGRLAGGVRRLRSALDPRKLPRRLHNLSTDVMSMFSPLLAREVGGGAAPPWGRARARAARAAAPHALAGGARETRRAGAPDRGAARRGLHGWPRPRACSLQRAPRHQATRPPTPPRPLPSPVRPPPPQIVGEVREKAESGAAPLAAVDAVASRRVRALAASDAPKFFLVAAASTSVCCAAVGAAKFVLRAVAAPLRVGPLRAGPPVMAVTGLMPTGVYGALLAGYFLFHGAQGALERMRDEERRGRPNANDAMLRQARGRLRDVTQGDHPQQKPAAALASRRSFSGAAGSASFTGGASLWSSRSMGRDAEGPVLERRGSLDSGCGSPTAAAHHARSSTGSGTCRITLKAGSVSRRSFGAATDDEVPGGSLRRASLGSDVGDAEAAGGRGKEPSAAAVAAANAVLA
jgi:hypothetical protein